MAEGLGQRSHWESAGTAVGIIGPVHETWAVMWEHGAGTCAVVLELEYAGIGAWAQGMRV